MIDEYYTTIFTPQELSAAASGLPVHLVSDDSVDEYELSHLPEGAWPPNELVGRLGQWPRVFDLPREECPSRCAGSLITNRPGRPFPGSS